MLASLSYGTIFIMSANILTCLCNSSAAIAPRLMQKISAKKEVTEETVLLASDVPPLGVKSDHPSELDKVF